jgi:protein-disulfide isomerase
MLKVSPNSNDREQGNAAAGITLIEYGDFECPYCRQAFFLVKELMLEWGNEVLFVYRHFPLRKIHPNAFNAALAAEAAGRQGKFWEMHERIFQNQDKLGDEYFLMSSAYMIGLDPGQFEWDWKSDKVRSKVESDFEGGVMSGVNGVPAFFINGLPLLTYNATYESLVNAIRLVSEIEH